MRNIFKRNRFYRYLKVKTLHDMDTLNKAIENTKGIDRKRWATDKDSDFAVLELVITSREYLRLIEDLSWTYRLVTCDGDDHMYELHLRVMESRGKA